MATFTTRPVICARRGVVTSGHYLATAAGMKMLEAGGNAVDAAAAMCFCLNLIEPQNNGIGGEVPTLIYSAKVQKTYAISGMGCSPAGFSIPWCKAQGIDLIPSDGFLPACVPAVVGTWALALDRFGTMRLADVLGPAIELAEEGFAVYPYLREALAANQARFEERYPTTAQIYFPGGRLPDENELLRNVDFAAMLRLMCDAEAAAAGGRSEGIKAARDVFYEGAIAERMIEFAAQTPVVDGLGKAHTALLTLDDMASWRAKIEEPVTASFGDLDVHKCSSWTQGPVFLQQLNLLEGFDLAAMGHNSAEYLHTVLECAKLAFADREAYYGDPDVDDVPLDVLLSKDYAAGRRELVGPAANLEMRPGDVGHGVPAYGTTFDVLEDNRRAMGLAGGDGGRDMTSGNPHIRDTTHLDAADAEGNMVAATSSGGWIHSSPVIDGLGFCLGTRGQMFYLNADRPNALQPRKRPRATLTPTMVTRNGRPYMAFGTPGGDMQDQSTLQFLLNHVVFGMNLQEAIDAPTVFSEHFPSSFYPRTAEPGGFAAEDRIDRAVLDALVARGHELRLTHGWSTGRVMAVQRDESKGVLKAAASPRQMVAYAMGW